MWGLKASKLCSALLPDYKKQKCLFFWQKKHIFSLFNFAQNLFFFWQSIFFATKNTYFLCLIFHKSSFFDKKHIYFPCQIFHKSLFFLTKYTYQWVSLTWSPPPSAFFPKIEEGGGMHLTFFFEIFPTENSFIKMIKFRFFGKKAKMFWRNLKNYSRRSFIIIINNIFSEFENSWKNKLKKKI